MATTYQWRRCDSAGASCVDIGGATASSYVLVGDDEGSRIRVVRTIDGVSETSAPTAIVQPGGTFGGPPTDAATDRWYIESSAFNTAIPGSPSIHANNSSFVAGFVADYNAHGGSFLTPSSHWDPVGYVDGSTPTVLCQRNCCSGCNTETLAVPIPAGSHPRGSGESHFILMHDDGTEWNFYELSEPFETPLRIGGEATCLANSKWQCQMFAAHTPAWKTGNGYNAIDTRGWRATKVNAGAGLIRTIDIQNTAVGGYFPHALAVMCYPTSNGATLGGLPNPKFLAAPLGPARAGDGTVSGGIPQGARIQLDPAWDVGVHMSGLPEWKKMIARTLQVYGAFVVDTGREMPREGPISDLAADPWIGSAGWTGTTSSLPLAVYQNLRVLDWNIWSGV